MERVARSGCAEPSRLAELLKLKSRLDPFELARIIDRKLNRIYELANGRLSPGTCPLHSDRRKWLRPDNGCGKAAFPHPRRRVFGNILEGATIHPKVTFLNGLTRAAAEPHTFKV